MFWVREWCHDSPCVQSAHISMQNVFTEEETKRRLREQRTREAESRRFKEKEERLKRLQEKENGENMYREMLRRKQVRCYILTSAFRSGDLLSNLFLFLM